MVMPLASSARCSQGSSLLAQRVSRFCRKNYIRHNFSAAALERIVGQAHRTDEVAALGNVLAGAVILFVQCTAGGDNRHDAAGAQLVDALGKEIVVNGKMQPVILRVIDLKLPKGTLPITQSK